MAACFFYNIWNTMVLIKMIFSNYEFLCEDTLISVKINYQKLLDSILTLEEVHTGNGNFQCLQVLKNILWSEMCFIMYLNRNHYIESDWRLYSVTTITHRFMKKMFSASSAADELLINQTCWLFYTHTSLSNRIIMLI